MVKEGQKAPAFTLEDQNGKKVSLSDFMGKEVVVYFYPKDDTPGCTTEACSFRDMYDQILAKGAVVLGISRDNKDSHINFSSKYKLPFHLLSDLTGDVIDAYEGDGEKKLMDKIHEKIMRTTFIIDAKGMVKKVFPKVTPEDHGKEVLAAL